MPGTSIQSPLTHFSNEPGLTFTDPRMYGTGIKGAEAERLMNYPGAVRDRSYFYMGEPGTVLPEPGLGVNRYRGESSNLYDITQDPLNFNVLARESNRTPYTAKYNQGIAYPTQDANDIERLVREYGYEGMANPKASKPMAIMFDKTPVQRRKKGGEVRMAAGGSVSDAKKRLLDMIAEEPHMAGGGVLKAIGKAQKAAKATKAVKTVERVAAPQEEALRLAQKRAALPTSKGGLGLPAKNTPAQRAAAMGIKTDAYHGTKQNITGAFKPGYDDELAFVTKSPEFANKWIGKGKHTQRIGEEAKQELKSAEDKYRDIRSRNVNYDDELERLKGKEFEDEYDRRSALARAEAEREFGGYGRPDTIHSTVYPLKVQANKTFNPETDMNVMADFFEANKIPQNLQDLYAGGNYMMYETKPVVEYLKNKGYDSMRLRESTGDDYPTIAVFDPESVRSRFAAFDPFRRNAATAAAMGVAAPDLLADEKKATGGEVHMVLGGLAKAQKAAKAAAKAAKVAPTPAAPAFIPGLMQKSTASQIGREERARRQAAAAAEAARVEAAKQTPVPVGYVKHTEKSPNPHVGFRFEATQDPGIAQPIPIDLAKLEREKKGASLGVMPWDSQSRNVQVSSISGEPLQTNLYTHGGQPYSLDEKHLAELLGGSSAEEVADAIKTRDMFAAKENREKGGTGEVVHAVTTMGQYGENYSHPPSDFAFEIINRRLQEGKLSAKNLQALNNSIRTFQDKKRQVEQGIFPYANFAGFETPEGLQQIYTGGLGLNTSSGNLRKAIAAKLHKVGTQELLGFNSEDLINATTVPSLRGVDKGYLGGTLLSNDIGNAGLYGPRKNRFGMELAPAEGFPYSSPYSTDFSARYYGQLPDLVPLDVVMHRQLAPIEQGLLARENKKPYTAKSLRNAAIGSLEKSNEGVSQVMDARFFQDLSDYFDALNKPLEKKKGGLAHTKKVKRHGNTVSN